jgi:membrane-associated protease RseP (regulator of RpoE activity)
MGWRSFCLAAVIANTPAVSIATDAQQKTPPLQRHSILGAAAAEADAGIRVTAVISNSAAERARLRVSDIITAIGDHQIRSTADFLATVKALPAGKSVGFTVLRDGAPIILPVVLASVVDEADPLVRTLYETLSVDGHLQRTLVTLPANGSAPYEAALSDTVLDWLCTREQCSG